MVIIKKKVSSARSHGQLVFYNVSARVEECDETDGQTALLTASGRMTAVSPDDSKCRTERRIAATG